MLHLTYWGAGGQFGPFVSQEDGWPNAGQVMRYFREKSGLTAKTFGRLYGKKIREDGKPICERWILEMELENKVPTDITRRRVIAQLLQIPPALFGLASLEEIISPSKNSFPLSTYSVNTLKKSSTDISKYEKNVRTALHLHRTSNAQNVLQDITDERRELEVLEGQAQGDLLYRIRELLVSYDLLAAKVVRDQRQYTHAYAYATHAVQTAGKMKDDELIATAKYTRGCIQSQWSQFSVVKQGRLQLDKNNLQCAIQDFEDVLNCVSSQKISLHPQLQGFTLLQLSRALGLLSESKYDQRSTRALLLTEQAAEMVGREEIDDLCTRMIVTGTLSGLHLGGYYLTRADIFNAIGSPHQAIHELNHLHRLLERTYGQDETRNQAWSTIVLSKALLGLHEYSEATKKAKKALISCHAIHSTQNVTIISDIHSILTSSSYRFSGDVKELGDMLEEWYGLLNIRNM